MELLAFACCHLEKICSALELSCPVLGHAWRSGAVAHGVSRSVRLGKGLTSKHPTKKQIYTMVSALVSASGSLCLNIINMTKSKGLDMS